MELQFQKTGIPCLYTVKREIQNQEQTQEIRISDGMPDIGNIIGAWGQVILRGKEWHDDEISVNGGTMVWVQYLPEEGGPPQSVESWIPFQMRWSIPSTQYDGKIMTQCLLKSVDARITSARKIMLRTNVSVLAQAMENQERELFTPDTIPEDVQIRTARYPILIPTEAGEKAFELEENLSLPPSSPRLENLICYRFQPEITEERIMGDKLIFRGNGTLHILYGADDGGEHSWDFDLPFSQYAELEREYADDADAVLWPCVTALEVDTDGDQLHLKAGLVCQYCISHRPLIEIVEDAYSPRRSVELQRQELELPGILERKMQKLHAQVTVPVEGLRIADTQFLPQEVSVRNQGEEASLAVPGQFQILYYDMDGTLQSHTQKWEEMIHFPLGEGGQVEAVCWPYGKTQGTLISGNGQLQADLQLFTDTVMNKGLSMVTGLQLGELQDPDPQRPSLILRRTGKQTLWEVAKETGSTVRTIQETNQLEAEPDTDRMLLIPVI